MADRPDYQTLTLPSGRSLEVVKIRCDPRRPWQVHRIGSFYVVRRMAVTGPAAWETATGSSELAIPLNVSEAKALADLLNEA